MSGPIRERWTELDAHGDTRAHRAGRLLRGAEPQAPGLSEARAQVLLERVQRGPAAGGTAAVVAGAGGAAVVLALATFWLLRGPAPATRVHSTDLGSVHRLPAREEAPEPEQELPARVPSPAPPVAAPAVVSQPKRARRGSRIAEEARLLAQALRQLREQRDPRGALETLAGYEAEFAPGALAREVEVARVEALLALGQRAEVLRRLRSWHREGFAARPRADEWRLLFAELVAEHDGCDAARPLFEALAAEVAVEAPLRARSRAGLETCEKRQGP